MRCWKRLTLALLVACVSQAGHAALTGSFENGTLRIVSDADDDIRIDCAVDTDARVSINLGGAPDVPSPLCGDVVVIDIVGGAGDNETRLEGVTPALFFRLQGTVQNGNGGNDTLGGSFASDIMDGGAGIDTMHGHDGLDSVFWLAGYGNDVFVGGAGDDSVTVGGHDDEEWFRLTALTDGVSVELGSPALETLAATDVARLTLIAGAGADRVETRPLAGVTQFLEGGDPAVFPGDELVVAGAGSNVTASPIVLPGGGAIHHGGFEFPPPAITVLKAAPVLQVDADANGRVSAGDTLSYRVRATNSGEAELHSVSVTDPLLAPAAADCAVLAPGAECVLDGTYVVTAQDAASGHVTNTASATSTQMPEPTLSNTVVTQVPAPVVAMTVTKSVASLALDSDGNGVVSAGDTLSYTAAVRNTGEAILPFVIVQDPLLVPSSRQCNAVPPGAECVLTGVHVVTAAEAAAGVVVNTAYGAGDLLAVLVPSNTVETPVFPSGIAVPAGAIPVPGTTPIAELLLMFLLLACGAPLSARRPHAPSP